ncbi:uncharacterized protein FMAN_15456 [Fusarium mangiferae]|uniref:Uncharacterized protein n=1 Tax=Fusarium mangiferae TaxID=192010 RepID=A0A1L7UM95_FUSMA|nr:uncharacterized protein FMAN_15456 [Fusarium mangiferae]CVL09215.1 uncharacterized protein FMAN_15456 [Fusarium mangiferae]
MGSVDMMYRKSSLYTSLKCITDCDSSVDRFKKACKVTALVEEIGSVDLTPTESVVMAYLLTYLSENINALTDGSSGASSEDGSERGKTRYMAAVGEHLSIDWST